MKTTHALRHGFTLIELSIVLVIIGLIIGGVLVGQDMIRNAELRKVVQQVESYQTATQTFREKYHCLPGDCVHALNYWPADASCPTTTANTIPKEETCNGNGNGRVYTAGDSSTYYEIWRYWQQLANTKLIPHQLSGVTAAAGFLCSPGVNVPTSPFSGSGYLIWNGIGLTSTPSGWFSAIQKHFYILGQPSNCGQPVMSPIDMQTLDSKIDDGRPGTGIVTTYVSTFVYSSLGGPSNCHTTDDPATSEYQATLSSIECVPWFIVNF